MFCMSQTVVPSTTRRAQKEQLPYLADIEEEMGKSFRRRNSVQLFIASLTSGCTHLLMGAWN